MNDTQSPGREALINAQRLVVKIGSALLTNDGRGLDDAAIGEPDDPGAAGGDVLIVGDDDEGGSAADGGAQQLGEDFIRGAGVEGTGRFVGEGDDGLGDLGAGDRHSLCLSAGELSDPLVHVLAQTETVEPGPGVLGGVRAAHTGEHGGERDIVDGGEFGQEQPLLEDEAEDLAAQGGAAGFLERGDLGGRAAVGRRQTDVTAVGTDDAGQAVQKGRLAGTGGSHDGQGFAEADPEIDSGESVRLVEVLRDVAGGDDGGMLKDGLLRCGMML